MKNIQYTEVEHVKNLNDKYCLLEINISGVIFYEPFKRRSLLNYSLRIAKWRIFRNINRIGKKYDSRIYNNEINELK